MRFKRKRTVNRRRRGRTSNSAKHRRRGTTGRRRLRIGFRM